MAALPTWILTSGLARRATEQSSRRESEEWTRPSLLRTPWSAHNEHRSSASARKTIRSKRPYVRRSKPPTRHVVGGPQTAPPQTRFAKERQSSAATPETTGSQLSHAAARFLNDVPTDGVRIPDSRTCG